jgi:hypothetical protein
MLVETHSSFKPRRCGRGTRCWQSAEALDFLLLCLLLMNGSAKRVFSTVLVSAFRIKNGTKKM